MKIIYEDILNERNAQDEKWGELHSRNLTPLDFLCILMEEVGEVAKDINEWNDIEVDDYRHELVQVAAVAVAAIEELDYQMMLRKEIGGLDDD